MKNKRNMVLKATPIKQDMNGNPVNELTCKPRVKKAKKRNR